MRFWRLTYPDYQSDYRHTFINGSLEHPFGLPGIECSECDATWGGSRILPFALPAPLRAIETLRERWPVSLKEHVALQQKVHHEFAREGITLPRLRPGDDFQPCYLDVPSRPRFDFLWASLGSVVVSERAKTMLESLGTPEITFCPVTLRSIGSMEPHLPEPIPSIGEPEDMYSETPRLERTDELSPYYELLIHAESGRPPGTDPALICEGCSREWFNPEQRKLVMLPSMWRGAPIFFLATSLQIIVTDEFKQCLEGQTLTNVEFEPCPSHESS